MQQLSGISASNGIAITKAYKLAIPNLSFRKTKITDCDKEVHRFDSALQASIKDLKKIKVHVLKNQGPSNAVLFKSHIKLLLSPKFINAVKRQIQFDKLNAEWALDTISKNMIRRLKGSHKLMDNHNVRKHARIKICEVKDIDRRLLSHLLNRKLPSLALISKPSIVVVHDLTPSDIAQLNTQFVKGVVADLGGRTAHSVIMARTIRIPAIVGVKNATKVIESGDDLALDGDSGKVIINPTAKQVHDFKGKRHSFFSKLLKLRDLRKKRTVSKDHVHLKISANINNINDLSAAVRDGAEGVGLYRTEFLFINSSKLPTEEKQYRIYKQIILSMKGKPVTFRTLDIGGDKRIASLSLPKEHNPFLGYRGIRIYLDYPSIFRSQLRAMLRASAFGEISIIFPMVSTIREFEDAKFIYEEERHRLAEHNVKMGQVHLGVMIETPSAAILSDKFAKVVDLVNIGTNDLVQFVMAADRSDSLVNDLYLPYDPSVIRLINHIVRNCHLYHTPVDLCGEMAASPIAIPLLLGMGIDGLSMNPASILRSRSLIKNLSIKKMRSLVRRVITQADSERDVIIMVHKTLKYLRRGNRY